MNYVWTSLRERAEKEGCIVVKKKWPGNGTPGVLQAASNLDLAHELAHWYIATEFERTLPWYGLGDPTNPMYNDGSDLVVGRRRTETAARVLSIILVIEAGSVKTAKSAMQQERLSTIGAFADCEGAISLLKERALWSQDREVVWNNGPREWLGKARK